jgi:predicted secreted acid phosphatase
MSKQTLRKFKKNDYSFDEEEEQFYLKNKVDKRKQKRFERAIKTKDISLLVDNDEFEDTWN